MSTPTKTLPSNGGITNPKWRYRSSVATDIRATFRRAIEQMRKEQTK